LGKTCLWRGLRPARAFRCSVFSLSLLARGCGSHYASGSDIFSLQAQGGGSPHLSRTMHLDRIFVRCRLKVAARPTCP
jgi:hypothetical protein